MMDSDEDEIFEKSVFDNDAISKGDLVWAPLKVDDNGGDRGGSGDSSRSSGTGSGSGSGRNNDALTRRFTFYSDAVESRRGRIVIAFFVFLRPK